MKNYFVVGAATGIGKSISELLCTKGNRVWGTFHSTVPTFHHENIEYFKLDVLKQPSTFDFLTNKIDGIVYCPGSINLKPFGRISPLEFKSDYDLQVIGAIEVIQKIVKSNLNAGGSIVLFSTVAVQMGFKFHSQVSASKGAIEGLTRALAAEFAPNYRVNCVAPSLTDTPLASKLLSTEDKRVANAARHPLNKIGEAKDIATMVEFLLSENSAWITGQILHVDGGMSTLKV